MKRKDAGFTLLELLVVVIIIGILASVALPNFSKMQEKAKVDEAKGVLLMIYQAQRMHHLDTDTYGTVIPPGQTGAPGTLVSGQYISDPNPNSNWLFRTFSVSGSTFSVEAKRTGGGLAGKCLKIDQANALCQNGYGPPYTDLPACSSGCNP